jgi:hypothetical protein
MHEDFRKVGELPILPIGIRQRYLDEVGKVGNGTPSYVLTQQDVDVGDLVERGLVEERDGVVRPK